MNKVGHKLLINLIILIIVISTNIKLPLILLQPIDMIIGTQLKEPKITQWIIVKHLVNHLYKKLMVNIIKL